MNPITPQTPSVIFDCDGVILQSNALKSDAFGLVLEGHDPQLVSRFVDWHKATGGVSRFHKFAHFFQNVLNEADWQTQADAACEAFGEIVSQQLRRCEMVPGCEDVLEYLKMQGIRAAVNTGGAEREIRDVFAQRNLANYFEMILGSPTTKHENMVILRDKGLLQTGSVYLGDSELDFELAQAFDLHFIYVGFESEWEDGARITKASSGTVAHDLTGLIDSEH